MSKLRAALRREWRKDKDAEWVPDNYTAIIEKRTPEFVRELLEHCWNKETAYDRDKWTQDKPSTGQCAVSSLIVQDIFDGSIVRAVNDIGESHYYNRINGEDLDLTKDQFDDYDYHFDRFASRSEMLEDWDLKLRYWRLRRALDDYVSMV